MMRKGTATPVFWDELSTPEPLRPVLASLAEDYPVYCGKGKGICVSFELSSEPDTLVVSRRGDHAIVRYHTLAHAARGVGTLLAELVPRNGERREHIPFTMFGIMLDCSRNAVITVPHLKKWLRRLALLGYNTAMLYTEDTYELEGEPFFGYLRGAYTADELREIDRYAGLLGIEMIPCFQTLGHLGHVLKWAAYRDIKDTDTVLLVGEEKTYALIEKMIAHWQAVYRSRRIHIGMDEAWDLGRGAYLTRNGYTEEFELFNRHLSRVNSICTGYGLRPMIWSDMYFTIASHSRQYYDREAVIPEHVRERIPTNVQLVYWDYYHEEPDFYLDYITKHRSLGFEPVMASGVWTWSKLWYDRAKTEAAAGACIEACLRAGLKEIFFTMWGDDGAYCDFDSAFAGLAYVAEKSYNRGYVNATTLARRYAAVCKADYATHQRASDLHHPINPQRLMWDDPLLQPALSDVLAEKKVAPAAAVKTFVRIARDLKRCGDDREAGDMRLPYLYARFLADKIDHALRLRKAYATRDRRALRVLRRQCTSLQRQIEAISACFRAMWLRHNKPFGLEVIQSRYATLSARYAETATRIGELLSGAIEHIAELEEHARRVMV